MTITINGSTGISSVDGTAAAPALTGTDTNTGIFFPAADTIAFAEGGAEVMRINSSGNVGIGTSSPATKLEVSGGAANTYIRINDTRATPPYLGSESGALVFGRWGVGESARIDSSGNLLVGTTSSATSSVGAGFQLLSPGVTGAYVNIGHNSGAVSGYSYLIFSYANASIGAVQQNGTTGVSYTTSSDYRLKHDIQPMISALEKVAALNPVTYKWNVDNSDGQGFIAHELQVVVPECVTGEKDAVDAKGNPRYQGIDTSFLVATLTAAIQEQQALITSLTTRLTALENK